MNQTRRALKDFYDKVGEKYPEEEMVYQTLRGRLRKKFVLAYLNRFQGSLLDIGCNRGMYLMHYNGGSRFGVDLSKGVLENTPRNGKLNLVIADAEQLQCFKENSFDNILCSEVLEHCLNPLAVFQSISFVLNSKGYALVTTPNYRKKRPEWINLGVLTQYGIDSDCQDGYFHTAYRPEELADLARQAGLDIVDVGTLEKEVKYAAKIPAAIMLTGRAVNKVIKSKQFEKVNERFFDTLTNWIYDFCRVTRLDKMMMKFVSEGVRSYILLQKKQESEE